MVKYLDKKGLEEVIINIQKYVDKRIGEKINSYFPVGYVYISFSNTDPGEIFGGKWEQLEDVFLLATGSKHNINETGGEETHVLSIREMPSHQHTYGCGNNMTANDTYSRAMSAYEGAVPKSLYTSASGGTQPHNNMPPYIATYMWKRIA